MMKEMFAASEKRFWSIYSLKIEEDKVDDIKIDFEVSGNVGQKGLNYKKFYYQ